MLAPDLGCRAAVPQAETDDTSSEAAGSDLRIRSLVRQDQRGDCALSARLSAAENRWNSLLPEWMVKGAGLRVVARSGLLQWFSERACKLALLRSRTVQWCRFRPHVGGATISGEEDRRPGVGGPIFDPHAISRPVPELRVRCGELAIPTPNGGASRAFHSRRSTPSDRCGRSGHRGSGIRAASPGRSEHVRAVPHDLARAHAAGVHRDELVVEAGKPALPLHDQLRIEARLPVPRHLQFELAGVLMTVFWP